MPASRQTRSCSAVSLQASGVLRIMTLDHNRWQRARISLLFILLVSPLLTGVFGPSGASVAQAQPTASDYRGIGESAAGQMMTESAGPVVVAESRSSPLAKSFVLKVVYDPATDVISVKSREAPLDAVLREISRRTHLTMSLPKGVLDERISVEFNRLPLEHALKRLLEGANSTFIYDVAGDAPSDARRPRLVKVVVFSKKVTRAPEKTLPREATTSGTTPSDRPDFLSDQGETLRALLRGGSEAKEIVNALRQPAKDQEREEIIEALLRRLDNGRFPSDDGVLAALKDLAPERATEALVNRLQTPDTRTRVLAAASLGRLAEQGAVEPLLSLLAEDDAATRQVAATSLALIGGERAMDSLLRDYVAGSNAMRYAIAVAIASHGDAESQTVLANLAAAGLAPREPTAQEAGFITANVR